LNGWLNPGWLLSPSKPATTSPPIPAKGLPKQQVGFGMGVEAGLDLVLMEIGGQIFALNSL
jgi:hypothetical protein